MKKLLTLAIAASMSIPVLVDAAELVAKVRPGGVGVLGPIPMPPNGMVKDADVKTLAASILTLK